MFLLDDILLAPARGLMSVFRSLYDAAQEELAHEAQRIRNELSEMYVLLETGRLSEEEFDRLEGELLERLERIDSCGEDETDSDEQRAESDEDEEVNDGEANVASEAEDV